MKSATILKRGDGFYEVIHKHADGTVGVSLHETIREACECVLRKASQASRAYRYDYIVYAIAVLAIFAVYAYNVIAM